MRLTIKTLMAAWMLTLIVSSVLGQGKTHLSGTILETGGQPVIGANVYFLGTTIGTVSDLSGNFTINTSLTGEQTLVISSVGFLTIERTLELTGAEIELGTFEMESDAVGLEEVVVFASVAIDRKTPVPVSNIKPEVIETQLGMQEYPEILKSTPGVYATKQGGAFGDSRINIRGFNSRYSAVMINGVPVNDMENGWVYWSNWAGLSDVTRTMQVQRGLGAARIAIPSVGGTINILTKTTDAERGGNVYYGVGNDGFSKLGFSLSSGLTDNNWATTISLSKSQGVGYVDGTQFESWSYYLNISKMVNEKHRLAFSLFGAPQWHGQRYDKMSIDTYKSPTINSIRYSADWGYKNGQVYFIRRNYYHKPMGILNHFWDVNPRLNISTAAYLSIGTGGGSGPLGTPKFYDPDYLRENQPDIDRIVDENIAAGANGSETILRNSVNNHFWTGLLSHARWTRDWLVVSGGIDLRYYLGEHYREVADLLGGDYYLEQDVNVNNPVNVAYKGDKIAYYDDGIVGWYGVFGQGEATFGKLNAFVSASLSNKSYKRKDYFIYLDSDPDQTSKSYNFIGFSGKGGANYNLTDHHNVFLNLGYFENQPDFTTIFYNYNNDANLNAPNEKVASFELGYGYRSSFFSANVNAYYTTWSDKSRVIGYRDNAGQDRFANMTGINARHQGIELDFVAQPISRLSINGMLSVGDWRWMNDLLNVEFYDDDRNLVATESVYIKDVHVGDAAQTTAALGLNYELLAGLKLGANYNYYDNLFSFFDPESRTTAPEGGKNPDAWKVPDYHLMDLYLAYRFNLGPFRSTLVGNINNLFDTEYISDAEDGATHDWQSAKVFYGWGRSWIISLRINF
jgi:iron complex outermembrane receptor protein